MVHSEDEEKINLNNDDEDDADEDDNQNLNIEPPLGIELAYSTTIHMSDIGNNRPWEDHEFGHLIDHPKELVYELRMLFRGMRFPNKANVKYAVNIYRIKNNRSYKVTKSGTDLG